jgi:hypothetical protein
MAAKPCPKCGGIVSPDTKRGDGHYTRRITPQAKCKPAQIATAPLPCPVNDKDNVLDESGDYLF